MDVQAAVSQRAGVGRYTQKLVQHMDATLAGDRLVLFSFDFARRGQRLQSGAAEERVVRWCPGRVAQWLWKHGQGPAFDRFAGAADVYHFPNFVLPPLRRGRSVVTVHDMSFLRYPQFAEPANLAYLRKRIGDTVSRADMMITDSRFSADEIVALLNVAPERVRPIHLGVSPEFCPPGPGVVRQVLKTAGLRRPYLLTVGTVEPRKNIPFLIDLFESLTEYDGLLVVAGAPGWHVGPILERIETSPRSADIVRLDYVPDAQLPGLYAGADAFLCASYYEGFGFPPLEAMACGTPAVCSARGSLREVLSGGAVLLDVFDVDAWRASLRRVLEDGDYRNTLTAAGRRRASEFTWQKTARETVRVYREVAA